MSMTETVAPTVTPDTPAAPIVTGAVDGHVGTITLNNAAKRNALSQDLLDAFMTILEDFRTRSVRVVILRAASGMKVWSAGHDIRELPKSGKDPLGYNDPLEQALRAVRCYPGPIIAMVQGTVWGGAFDLVLSCDMIFADETSSFAITPANLGLPYNTSGLLHCMNRLPLNLIKEMFFSAAPIKAQEAERWGIINHLVPADELEEHTHAFAELMATKAPLAIAVVKEQLRVLSDYQPVATQVFERLQGMRREIYNSADYKEGIEAFLEKRKPVFLGK